MADLKQHQVVHLTLENIHTNVALIDGVTNGTELKDKLISGDVSAALLSTKNVYDLWQLKVAIYKAVTAFNSGKGATRTLYSEILYCLHPTRQISQAFKQFGMQVEDKSCIAVTVGDKCDEDMQTVLNAAGLVTVLPFEQRLTEFNNLQSIKKMYKIMDKELEVGPLSQAVGNRIAAKEFLT